MAENFNMFEVKQIALHLEEDGFAFYMAMADVAKSSKAKAIFLKLASDEKEHIKWIEALDIDDIQVGSEADLDMINDYIRNVVKSGIFPNPQKAPEVMKDIKNDSDGIRIGMNAESKSVKFFDQLHKNVLNENSKEVLLKLKEQEIQHYKLLKDFLEQLEN